MHFQQDDQTKIADTEAEFEMIHRLNYKIFVEEIPQHETNKSRSLIDRFHNENTYLISMDGDKLAGMLAVRGNRPFSLDFKIPDLDQYLPKDKKVCEIRLLAVEKEYRGRAVFFSLMKKLAEYCKENQYDYAIISGTTRQQKLYSHLGFTPFYPAVGKEGAYYIPMYATVDSFYEGLRREKG